MRAVCTVSMSQAPARDVIPPSIPPVSPPPLHLPPAPPPILPYKPPALPIVPPRFLHTHPHRHHQHHYSPSKNNHALLYSRYRPSQRLFAPWWSFCRCSPLVILSRIDPQTLIHLAHIVPVCRTAKAEPLRLRRQRARQGSPSTDACSLHVAQMKALGGVTSCRQRGHRGISSGSESSYDSAVQATVGGVPMCRQRATRTRSAYGAEEQAMCNGSSSSAINLIKLRS
ncbi:hypothetical protein C8F01DRAFT_1192136 [Mycena amicta]|nr:hypothetical protein C8F01DRAFT_1192136 [Mycena amicta]